GCGVVAEGDLPAQHAPAAVEADRLVERHEAAAAEVQRDDEAEDEEQRQARELERSARAHAVLNSAESLGSSASQAISGCLLRRGRKGADGEAVNSFTAPGPP